MSHADRRSATFAALGASEAVSRELLAYTENRFVRSALPPALTFPLDPEPHIAAWEQYARRATSVGVIATLRSVLVQLNFPIARGMSQSEAYRAVTRRGVSPDNLPEATGVQWTAPDRIQLLLHDSLAGRIPVLICGHRNDFVRLIQALTKHNEPEPVADAMGACIVGGYNNWERIAALRRRWQANPAAGAPTWKEAFQHLRSHPERYQDRFIVLSTGPYSGIPAAALGLSDEAWYDLSHTIRLEHECTHYLTRRLFQSMRNNVLDELIADYRGIVATRRRFRADWFLRGMGLEAFPSYRAGGRLENYRGDPPLSDEAFHLLQLLVTRAAAHLEACDRAFAASLVDASGQARFLCALCLLSLDELASETWYETVLAAWREIGTSLAHT
jgi:hypothetical protein